jgi:transposase
VQPIVPGLVSYVIEQALTWDTWHAFVLGTNLSASELSDTAVITTSKSQSRVEEGFRFRKDPLFLASSLFVKKPCRIQGLLMVMTLALLVYSVAQR